MTKPAKFVAVTLPTKSPTDNAIASVPPVMDEPPLMLPNAIAAATPDPEVTKPLISPAAHSTAEFVPVTLAGPVALPHVATLALSLAVTLIVGIEPTACQTNLEMSHLVQDRNVTLVAFPRDRWASYV